MIVAYVISLQDNVPLCKSGECCNKDRRGQYKNIFNYNHIISHQNESVSNQVMKRSENAWLQGPYKIPRLNELILALYTLVCTLFQR